MGYIVCLFLQRVTLLVVNLKLEETFEGLVQITLLTVLLRETSKGTLGSGRGQEVPRLLD